MDDYTSGVQQQTIVENAELNLVRLFNLIPYKDEKDWCYLLGENLQEGICGFGASPYLAALDFNKNFYKKESP